MEENERKRRIDLIEESGGIASPYHVFYIHSLFYSAQSCVFSAKRAIELFESGSNADMVFASLHEGLLHAAACSRYIWPSEKRLHKIRGERLQKLLGFSDQSALKDRKLRNMLEHYDEKLDNFLLEDLAGNFYPNTIYINPQRQIAVYDHLFKAVSFEEGWMIILGQKIFFASIFEEVFRLYDDLKTQI